MALANLRSRDQSATRKIAVLWLGLAVANQTWAGVSQRIGYGLPEANCWERNQIRELERSSLISPNSVIKSPLWPRTIFAFQCPSRNVPGPNSRQPAAQPVTCFAYSARAVNPPPELAADLRDKENPLAALCPGSLAAQLCQWRRSTNQR